MIVARWRKQEKEDGLGVSVSQRKGRMM